MSLMSMAFLHEAFFLPAIFLADLGCPGTGGMACRNGSGLGVWGGLGSRAQLLAKLRFSDFS